MGSANLEAATQSLPIVASNVGGIPEIVFNGINGFLFTSEDSMEFAKHIVVLMKDQSLRERMGTESFRIVNEWFNFEKQINTLMSEYFILEGTTLR